MSARRAVDTQPAVAIGRTPLHCIASLALVASMCAAFGYYVVTTDGGNTWSDWDAMKALPEPKLLAIIKNVNVSGDGTGSMEVWRSTKENSGLLELGTTDFGGHWALKSRERRA
jgi:hypothetical protein